MRGEKQNYAPVSVFRSHPKTDDPTLIQLVYYFCNGISVKAVAGTLNLSRKTVRAHYLDLRARLTKPKFARWHRVYSALVMVPNRAQERLIKAGLIEALAVCYYSACYANYASGQRKKRICRNCPLPHAFGERENIDNAVGAIDDISAFYRRLGIRAETQADKQRVFLERFIHACVIASVRENSKRLPNGLLNPADTDYQGAGSLLAMLMDDLADDQGPRFAKSD